MTRTAAIVLVLALAPVSCAVVGCAGGPPKAQRHYQFLVVTTSGDSLVVDGWSLGVDNQTIEIFDNTSVRVFRAPRATVRLAVRLDAVSR